MAGVSSSGKKQKKKSKGNNNACSNSTNSPPKRYTSSSKEDEEEKYEVVQSMFVRLTSCSEQQNQQQDERKQVIMNAKDMKRLNNSKEDDPMLVLLLCHNKLQAAEVCHALSSTKQQQQQQPPPQQRSPSSRSSNKTTLLTTGGRIKEGEIMLLPILLHEWFYNTANNLSSPTYPTLIISPLKTCALAKRILNRICQPATELMFQLVDKNQRMESLSSGQYKMLCTLTHAHLLRGSYYSQQFLPNSNQYDNCNQYYELNLSFQGLMQTIHLVSSSYEQQKDHYDNSRTPITLKQDEKEQDHQDEIYRVSTQLQNTLALSTSDTSNSQTTSSASSTSTQWMEQYLEILGSSTATPPVLLLRASYGTTVSFCRSAGGDDNVEQHHSVSSTRSNGNQPQASNCSKVVIGLDSILKELHSILTPALLNPQLFQQSNGSTSNVMRAPRGVLLYGPSGVGKTALASQFAREVSSLLQHSVSRHVKVEYHPCISLISNNTILGHAERAITSIFNRAELASRKEGVSTLIILDDIQWICPRRDAISNISSSSSSVAATLLALLDGITTGSDKWFQEEEEEVIMKNYGNVCILGVTANPSILDPALRRPGRLDREIEVPIPDDIARSHILHHQLVHVLGSSSCTDNLVHEQSILQLAKLAKGFTGADTMMAVKEACRMALIRHENTDQAKELLSKEGQSFKMTIEDIQRAISSTNPSSIRHVAVQVPTVRWEDIGGMHDVKRAIREAIEFPTTHSEVFSSLGIAAPRGVLLYGPPGTAKTMLAKAVATEVNMNFLAVKGPELLSKWLGESERTLATLFRRARQASPCVIFFDEIDAIGSKRGGSDGVGVSGGERLLSQLLTELDGINSSKERRVVVVGATNRPDLLDPALTRPGRIDRMIYVGVPDQESRESIIRLGLANKRCDDDVDLAFLSSEEITGGYTGAELIAICRDAALYAIEEEEEVKSGNPMVAMRHLLKSVKGTRKQVTRDMIQFYERYRRV